MRFTERHIKEQTVPRYSQTVLGLDKMQIYLDKD